MDDLNVRSARLAERLGFVCEKVFDEIIERDTMEVSPDLVEVSPVYVCACSAVFCGRIFTRGARTDAS